ncbi:hypothetical protein [Marinibacterium sp. SX1]|uniref:hypothetical protein n=1 Tax=Marinibacterium sp. SX1 TaxID=3388424 RepID=UPI003D171896
MLMMPIDVSDFERGTTSFERKQMPYATMLALNETAGEVLEHQKDRMRVVFDRPTRFALNAFMVWRAKKSDLRAEIKERPSVSDRHFLKVQERGGQRPQTGLERLLDSRLAYGGQISAAIPASGARTNVAGNWTPGERNQVLSAIQSQRDGAANTTEASRSRHKKRAQYFVPSEGSKLSAGVWKRSGKKKLSKVLHFTKSMPAYRKRLGFYDGAQDVFRAKFPVNFRKAFAKALASAR